MSLTKLYLQKCREDGQIRRPGESDECPSCGNDDKWSFFCERHNKMYANPVCDACEREAEQKEAARRAIEEEQEQRRLAAEAAARRQHEFEQEQLRKLEEAKLREKAFTRIARIPAYVALGATLLCMGLAVQFFTHGEIVIPYTAPLLFTFLGINIAAALSIFIIAIFFEM